VVDELNDAFAAASGGELFWRNFM